MNIIDLDFQNNVGENRQISGGRSAFAHGFNDIKERFFSVTGKKIGNFDGFSDAEANGTNKAGASVSSNFHKAENQLSFSYSTNTSGSATTPD